MAKRVITSCCCALLSLSAFATITNIAQCIDLELTTERLSNFPACDNSTPQNCLLNFVKGSITGDYLLFLTPLSNAVRIEESGVSDLSQVTSSMTSNFHAFVISAGFSNHVVRGYSETVTNNIVYATTFIQSRCGLMNKTNEVRTVMENTGGCWKISFWDVDE